MDCINILWGQLYRYRTNSILKFFCSQTKVNFAVETWAGVRSRGPPSRRVDSRTPSRPGASSSKCPQRPRRHQSRQSGDTGTSPRHTAPLTRSNFAAALCRGGGTAIRAAAAAGVPGRSRSAARPWRGSGRADGMRRLIKGPLDACHAPPLPPRPPRPRGLDSRRAALIAERQNLACKARPVNPDGFQLP